MSGKGFLNLDVLAVLPTRYGKTLIFCLLPALLFAKKNGTKFTNFSSIIIVVSPLNALIANQVSRLNSGGIKTFLMMANPRSCVTSIIATNKN